MFKNRNEERNNICGGRIKELRKGRNWSQRELADKLKECGIDINKNAIQRIEAGQRFVTDIEILALSKVLDCKIADLLDEPMKLIYYEETDDKLTPEEMKMVLDVMEQR